MVHPDIPGIIENFTNYSEYKSSGGEIDYQINNNIKSDDILVPNIYTDSNVNPIMGQGSYTSFEPSIYSGGPYSDFQEKQERIQSSIFKKTDSWDGSSPSMIFRDGSMGVGYYEDTMYNSLSSEEMEQINITKDKIIQRGYDYSPYEVILPDEFGNYPRITKIREEKITEDDMLLQKEREFIESKSFEGLSPCVGEWTMWNRNMCGAEGLDNCAVKKRRYTVISPGDILGQPCPFKDGEEQYDYCWGENDYDRCGIIEKNMCDCDPNIDPDNMNEGETQDLLCDLKTNNNYCNCNNENEEDNYHYTIDHKCSLKNCNCPDGINEDNLCYVHNNPMCSSCPDSGMVEQVDDTLFLCKETTDSNIEQTDPSYIDCDTLSYKHYELMGDPQLLRSSCDDKDHCEIRELFPPTNICKPVSDMRCQCKYGIGKEFTDGGGQWSNTCVGESQGYSIGDVNFPASPPASIGYLANDCSQCANGHERVASFGDNSDYNKRRFLQKFHDSHDGVTADDLFDNYINQGYSVWLSLITDNNGGYSLNNLSESVMSEPIYEMSCIQKKCDIITQEQLTGPNLQNIIAPSDIAGPIDFFNYHESFKCKEGTRFLPSSDYKTSENIHDTSLRLINCTSTIDHYLSEPNIYISGEEDPDGTIKFNGTCVETSCPISLSDTVLTNNYTLYDLMDTSVSCDSDSNNCGLGNDLQCAPSCGCKQCYNTGGSDYDLLELQRNNMGINMEDVEMMEQARQTLNICDTPFLKCDSPPFMSRLEDSGTNSIKYHGCNFGTEANEPSPDDCIQPENADEYIVNAFGRYSYSQWNPGFISCADGYYNNPGVPPSINKCSDPGMEYVLEGCLPSECVLPDIPEGYSIVETSGITYNYKINEWDPPPLSCNPGYYEDGIVSIEPCTYNGGEAVLQGCTECSGPDLGDIYYQDEAGDYYCEPTLSDPGEIVLNHCTSSEGPSTLSGCELRACSYPTYPSDSESWSYVGEYSVTMAGYSAGALNEGDISPFDIYSEPTTYIQCNNEGYTVNISYCSSDGGPLVVNCDETASR